ncbi:6-bladed beta-propeller [Parabacteroides sp. OttesenSCG-928-B22]|nr:6-bladed beta-propeller [Parabacteroides sp. OttesenSCG-928-B22]
MILVFVFICLLLNSCSEKVESDHIIHSDAIQNSKACTNLADLFDVEFIPLETLDESLLGRSVGKVVKKNGQFYISCDRKYILVFDHAGKYLFQINKQGGGPGEYTNLSDFDVTEEGDIVVLNSSKIIKYDPSGNMIASFDIDITGFNLSILDKDRMLVCASGEDYLLYAIDTQGHVLSKDLYNKGKTSMGKNIAFNYLPKQGFMYQYEFTNTFMIYDKTRNSFNEQCLIPVEMNVINMSDDKRMRDRHGYDYYEKLPQTRLLGGVSMYSDYLLFSIGSNSDGFSVYIADNVKNNSWIISDKTKSDIGSLSPFVLLNNVNKCISDDCFVTYIAVDQLVEELELGHQFLNEPLTSYFNRIEKPEEENPVLILLKIKK